MKKITVIYGHPALECFCSALKQAYCDAAELAGAEVTVIDIGRLNFDPNLHNGYQTIQPLEPDLLEARNDIEQADHLMIIFPVWWGGLPAVLKGFIDRTFLPGWAFSYSPDALLPNHLLAGKSARVMVTMDNYPFIFRFLYGMPAIKQIKNMTLKFCGISPVKVNMMGSVKHAAPKKRRKWLMLAAECGRKDALSNYIPREGAMDKL